MARRRSMNKRESTILWGILGLAILLTIIVSSYLFFQLRSDAINDVLERGENIRLLIGIHDDDELIASLLLFFQPETGQAMSLYVPLNLSVQLQTGGKNVPISQFFDPTNMDRFMQLLSDSTGTDIQHYLLITSGQFGELLDLLGGVNMTMSDATTQDIHFFLLNGDTFPRYLREIVMQAKEEEQIEIYNYLIAETMQDIAEQNQRLLHRTVEKLFFATLSSNLEKHAIRSFVQHLASFDGKRMLKRHVQGIVRRVALGNEEVLLLFPYFEGQWLRRSIARLEQSLQQLTDNPEQLFMQVILLNGTTRNGLASRTQPLLESYGFDIISIGNAERNDIERTLIISHNENMYTAQRIGEIIQTTNITHSPNTSLQGSEATVILGNDFDGSYVRK